LNFSVALNTILAVMLAAARAGAWLAVCPPFSTRGIPVMVKGLLSVAIAVPMTPLVAGQLPTPVTAPVIIAALVEQVAIGMALGFVSLLMFSALQSAGNLLDLFGGFSLAFAIDPFGYQGNAVFGRFYNIMATALLFGTDAHQMVLRGFTLSYKAVPLNGNLSWEVLSRTVTTGMGEMFVAALQIAGPLVAVLFCTDIALGLLSRAAPALNPFNLGFPAKILMTLLIAGSALMLVPSATAALADKAVHAVLRIIGA
jgi:flagellar biosynthetic protein FliR